MFRQFVWAMGDFMDNDFAKFGIMDYIWVTLWPPLALLFTAKPVLGILVSLALPLVVVATKGIGAVLYIIALPFAYARLRSWKRGGTKAS